MVAWMSVVIFQAVIHYGIIGPKKRQRLLRQDEAMQILDTVQEEEPNLEVNKSTEVNLSYDSSSIRMETLLLKLEDDQSKHGAHSSGPEIVLLNVSSSIVKYHEFHYLRNVSCKKDFALN